MSEIEIVFKLQHVAVDIKTPFDNDVHIVFFLEE